MQTFTINENMYYALLGKSAGNKLYLANYNELIVHGYIHSNEWIRNQTILFIHNL